MMKKIIFAGGGLLKTCYQLLCFVDKSETIIKVFGDDKSFFHTSVDILQKGNRISTVNWCNVFPKPMQVNESYQSLRTNRGEEVYIHSYPLKGLGEFKEGTLYVFTKIYYDEKPDFITSLIFKSSPMKQIMSIVQNVAQVDSTVLLLGESGVGKTALAKLIHEKSNRKNGPFLSINCASLPENLIESELFGYEPGTFTGGSSKGKKGLFESAEHGSILLDEIAELPFFMQSKLLDVVQENKIRRVGGVQKKKVNVRILAATNQNLDELVKKGKFREDLYYRLNVVPIHIPPLRDRKADIPEMITNFLKLFNHKYGRHVEIEEDTMQELIHYNWPGNIRELANKMERIVVTNNHSIVRTQSLGARQTPYLFNERISNEENQDFPTLKDAKNNVEKELISKAYERYKNTYKTAKALGVDQSTISKKLKKYNIRNQTRGGSNIG